MLVKGATGHNQGGHWRCDCVTDLVFQEKSYKTNLHLFSAYAGVVWRSVNKNNRSRESIFWEKVIYGDFFIPFEQTLTTLVISDVITLFMTSL